MRIETDDVIVSNHGERRCRERLGLPRRAVVRTVAKAWREGLRLRSGDERFLHIQSRGCELRVRNGWVFVFGIEHAKPMLVTVLSEKQIDDERIGVRGLARMEALRATKSQAKRRSLVERRL